MLSPRRILDAVTLRRVVAVLLLGGFAEAIASFLSWLVSVGWELKDLATLRACLLAAIVFAVDAVLIYLALHGLGSLLDHWRKGPAAIVAEPAIEEQDPTVPLEEIDTAGAEAAGWPREGEGDGSGREYY
jgi:uncharacterized membrane protein YjjB (DUF3815 family)